MEVAWSQCKRARDIRGQASRLRKQSFICYARLLVRWSVLCDKERPHDRVPGCVQN